MKLFPRMLSQRWNSFWVCSASDEICSGYAQHILNVDFEMDWDSPFAETKTGYSLAEHARKFDTGWLSMCENWLLKWHNLPEAWDGLRGWPTPENTGLQGNKLYVKIETGTRTHKEIISQNVNMDMDKSSKSSHIKFLNIPTVEIFMPRSHT